MGTYCEIQVYDSDSAHAQKALTEALNEMERVDRLLSNYDPSSELSVMNREASESPCPVSAELFDFLEYCRTLHRATFGAFDPTVGPLVRAWGFFTTRPAKPSEMDIASAKSKLGFEKILLDDDAQTVYYPIPGMMIDPGGVGKGYAVDRAIQVLKRRDIHSALVSAGGSTLAALGKPPDRQYWRVGIRNPADPRRFFAVVCLRDSSVSTSGVSEKSVRIGSHLYSHIFDPRTGEPAEGVCQVSVVAQSATESEALSKAAFILSHDSILEVFEQRPMTHALRVEGSCGGKTTTWETPGSSSVFIRDDP